MIDGGFSHCEVEKFLFFIAFIVFRYSSCYYSLLQKRSTCTNFIRIVNFKTQAGIHSVSFITVVGIHLFIMNYSHIS